MVRKAGILGPSYSSLQSIYCPHSGLATPSYPYPFTLKKQPTGSHRGHRQRNAYATVQSPEPEDLQDLTWPSSTSAPSPYQIFHLTPRSAYSKRRFYELVKLYHPDRSSHTSHPQSHAVRSLPGSVKMERYRLIVAANDILSNPEKRQAYDRTGAGWNGRLEHGCHPQSYPWGRHSSGETRWSGFDTNDSPFRNATWEDWEKWYDRHKKQEPVYVSNGGFLSLVVVALMLGTFGQSLQVDRHTTLFKELTEQKHENASQAMLKHRTDSEHAGAMDERVQRLLRGRDRGGVGYGGAAIREQEQVPLRALPAPVVCMSDGIGYMSGSKGQQNKGGGE